uniref:zinc-ribbon domain-containing protein n=1 Tax=Anaeromyxobacter terrae TaxID=2925406 RepID=UPI002436DE53
MRVGCPHCHAAYNIDDRRIPATGLNVRCPKCRETFPVRPAGADGGDGARQAGSAPVPLPGKAEGSVPLPSPASTGVPLPAPRSGAGGVPLPPPVPARPGQNDPFAPAATPAADPFGADVPDATADAVEATPDGALGFGEVELGAGPPAAVPAAPAFPSLDDTDPFAPAPGAPPFGAAPPPAAAPAEADPFGSATPPASASPAAPPAPRGEDLEMLFGEGASAPASGGARYRVRLASGKVVGPFDRKRVLDLLSRGELTGKEEVCQDGEDAWAPLREVEALSEAVSGGADSRRRGSLLPKLGRGGG